MVSDEDGWKLCECPTCREEVDDTDYHLDALEFLKLIESESADCVLYDPPYSLRQVVEHYKGVGRNVTQETTQATWRARHLDEIQRILKPGGKALCFGWNSNGVGKKKRIRTARDTTCSAWWK